MPFSESIVGAAWTRSGGVCECTGDGHSYQGRCMTRLLRNLQGGEIGASWRERPKVAWGADGLESCGIRCHACQGPRIRPAE